MRLPVPKMKVFDPYHPEATARHFAEHKQHHNKCISTFKRGLGEYSNGGLADVPEEQMSEIDAFEQRYKEQMAIPNEKRDLHWRVVDSGTRKVGKDGTIDYS